MKGTTPSISASIFDHTSVLHHPLNQAQCSGRNNSNRKTGHSPDPPATEIPPRTSRRAISSMPTLKQTQRNPVELPYPATVAHHWIWALQ